MRTGSGGLFPRVVSPEFAKGGFVDLRLFGDVVKSKTWSWGFSRN